MSQAEQSQLKVAVSTDRSFPHNMEFRCMSLNPEAPEFFPARYTLVSAPCFPIFTPLNPLDFVHCPPLSSAPYPLVISAPTCSQYYQLDVESQFSATEKAVAPLTEPVSSWVEPLKDKKGLYKHHWKDKRFGKEGFFRADHTAGVARKKEWRAKHSNGENKKHFGENVDGFPRKKKVQDWAANNKRGKHTLIPLKPVGKETTIMLKNIPIRYTREMLKDFLDQHCMLSNVEAKSQNGGAGDEEEAWFSAFDFLYLPMDFVTKSNKGYAFVNFTNPAAARKFYDEWHDTRWDCFKSNKILQIYCAKLQGVKQLVKHFERMGFPCEDFQPLSFNPARDGAKQPVEETVVGKFIGCSHSKSKSE